MTNITLSPAFWEDFQMAFDSGILLWICVIIQVLINITCSEKLVQYTKQVNLKVHEGNFIKFLSFLFKY